jgi:repressor LexA
MRFAEILKDLRKQNGLTQEALATQLKLSKSTISMYENGERTPTMEAMMPIAELFGVDMNYLYGVPKLTRVYVEDEIPLPSNVQILQMRQVPKLVQNEVAPSQPIPIFQPSPRPSRKIACPPVPFADEAQYDSYVEAPANLQADFCLTALDDSMSGARIQKGDIVFIRAQSTVENGKIAAVIVNNEAILRRWFYYPEKNKLVLTPENPAYEPLVFIGDEVNSVRCLGLSVSFMSDL